MRFTGSSLTVTEAEIEQFEDLIGAKLPGHFRCFLLQFNGGTVMPKRFSTADEKVESMVSRLFPLSDESDEDLLAEFEGFNAAKQLPKNLISIGKDPADNRIVMSVEGHDVGAIYYWSWDEEPTPASCSYSYVRIIADSFDRFLAGLR